MNAALEVTKRAMMAALRAGLQESDFAADFEAIARRRTGPGTRLRELEPRSSVEALEEPTTTGEKFARVAQAIIDVFTAENYMCAPSEKQQALLVPHRGVVWMVCVRRSRWGARSPTSPTQ